MAPTLVSIKLALHPKTKAEHLTLTDYSALCLREFNTQ